MYFVFTDPEYESMFSEILGCVITDDFEFARIVDLANCNDAEIYVLFHGKGYVDDVYVVYDLSPNLSIAYL